MWNKVLFCTHQKAQLKHLTVLYHLSEYFYSLSGKFLGREWLSRAFLSSYGTSSRNTVVTSFSPNLPVPSNVAGSLECDTVPGWCYFVGELHSSNARTGAYATEEQQCQKGLI